MFSFTVCNEAVTGCRIQSLQCVSTIACILSEAKHKLIAAVHPQIHHNMPFPGKFTSQNEPWEMSVGATLSKEAGDEVIEQAVRRCPASSNSVLSRQRRDGDGPGRCIPPGIAFCSAYALVHSYAAACSKPAAASRPAVGYDTERAYGRRKQVQ
jgi:hypothetical protein